MPNHGMRSPPRCTEINTHHTLLKCELVRRGGHTSPVYPGVAVFFMRQSSSKQSILSPVTRAFVYIQRSAPRVVQTIYYLTEGFNESE